jgi:hypothetical protein
MELHIFLQVIFAFALASWLHTLRTSKKQFALALQKKIGTFCTVAFCT